MMNNKITTFALIFCLNSIFTYLYIDLLIGTFDVQEIWDSFADNPVPLLPDVMQYNLLAGSLSLEDAINRLAEGSTAVHSTVLGYFFESGTLYSGILVNSFFVTLTFWLLHRNAKTTLFSYLLLAPFFVFYSVGWTKEIIYILALAFFIHSIFADSRINLYLSIVLSLLSRPQFAPLQIVASLTKNVSKKHFVIFVLIVLALAPIWLTLVPTPYTLAAAEFYEQTGGQGISVYTDYLKTNVPILSIIGYLVSVIKLYYEPLSSLIAFNGAAGIYTWIEFYVQVILTVNLIKSRFKVLENKTIFNLFLITNVLVSSLPFTHFRYLLPLLVTLLIYNSNFVPEPIKQNEAGRING